MSRISRFEDSYTATSGRPMFVIMGWISAVLSLFAYPFIFGVIGVIMGILASRNQSKVGLPVIVTSILFMGIGLIFNQAIMSFTKQLFGL